MSEEANAEQPAVIRTAKTKNDQFVSLKAWFGKKLGTTAGERLFKEFGEFITEATQSLPGKPGIVLDVKGGRVVSVYLPD